MRSIGTIKDVLAVTTLFIVSWAIVLIAELNARLTSETMMFLYAACAVCAWIGFHWSARASFKGQTKFISIAIVELKIFALLCAVVFVGVVVITNLKFFLGGTI